MLSLRVLRKVSNLRRKIIKNMLKKRTFRVDFRAYEYTKGYIEMTEDLVLPYRTEEPFTEETSTVFIHARKILHGILNTIIEIKRYLSPNRL